MKHTRINWCLAYGRPALAGGGTKFIAGTVVVNGLTGDDWRVIVFDVFAVFGVFRGHYSQLLVRIILYY